MGTRVPGPPLHPRAGKEPGSRPDRHDIVAQASRGGRDDACDDPDAPRLLLGDAARDWYSTDLARGDHGATFGEATYLLLIHGVAGLGTVEVGWTLGMRLIARPSRKRWPAGSSCTVEPRTFHRRLAVFLFQSCEAARILPSIRSQVWQTTGRAAGDLVTLVKQLPIDLGQGSQRSITRAKQLAMGIFRERHGRDDAARRRVPRGHAVRIFAGWATM